VKIHIQLEDDTQYKTDCPSIIWTDINIISCQAEVYVQEKLNKIQSRTKPH